MREVSAMSALLAAYAYGGNGRRSSVSGGNGTSTGYAYDPLSRLSQLAQNLGGTTYDLTVDLTRNPASQIATAYRSNFQFSFYGTVNATTAYSRNGLNQYTQVAGTTQSYDANGNLTGDGTRTFGYDVENRLVTASGGVTMHYDPMGRLYEIASSSGTTRFLYDGDNIVGEYDGSGAAIRRFVHGAGTNEPLVWYQLGDSTERRWLHADERGSIIGITNNAGTLIGGHNYDEHGNPQSGAILGRFGYTGQVWLPELGLWYYRARIYNPTLGRFLQTDPVGYEGGMLLYGYAANDPINLADPSGTCARAAGGGCGEADPYFGEVLGHDVRDADESAHSPLLRPEPQGNSTALMAHAVAGESSGSIVIELVEASLDMVAEAGRETGATERDVASIRGLARGMRGLSGAIRYHNLREEGHSRLSSGAGAVVGEGASAAIGAAVGSFVAPGPGTLLGAGIGIGIDYFFGVSDVAGNRTASAVTTLEGRTREISQEVARRLYRIRSGQEVVERNYGR